MYFPKRKNEPAEMDRLEHQVFGDLSSANYKRWFIPLVDDIIRDRSLPTTILDVGSGPGLLVKELASRSIKFSIIGIDISNDALAIAKNNCKRLPNVSFKKGSVYELEFADESFDIVVCKDSFHHFEFPQKALKEMWRVLKPGGLLYIQDLRRDVPMYLLKRSIPLQNTVQKLQYYSVRASHTKEEVTKLLSNLKPKFLEIRTRKISKAIGNKYKSMDIDLQLLKEAFQSRYIVRAKK